MKGVRLLALGLAVAAGLWLAACGGSKEESLVDLQIYSLPGRTVGGTMVDPLDPSQVHNLRIWVEGPGVITEPVLVPIDSRSAEVTGIPYGLWRQVVVETCAERCNPEKENDVIGRGKSRPTNIMEGDTVPPVTVAVAPRNSFVEPMDPKTKTPSNLNNGNRVGATATLLDDGTVLIAGGASVAPGSKTWFKKEDLQEIYADAEVYDPDTGQFVKVGDMAVPRAHHRAVKLGDGRVLMIGGYTEVAGEPVQLTSDMEIYDPQARAFQKLNPFPVGRALFTAALVPGTARFVFMCGGETNPPQAARDCFVYDAESQQVWQGGKVTIDQARYNHAMVVIKDFLGSGYHGFFLFGGQDDQGVVGSVEVVIIPGDFPKSPAVLRKDYKEAMPFGGRTLLNAVYVKSQQIIYVVGGFLDTDMVNASDRIDLYRGYMLREGKPAFRLNREGKDEALRMAQPRGAATATLLDQDVLFIAGGLGEGGYALASTEAVLPLRICNPQCVTQVSMIGESEIPDLDPPRAGHVAVLDLTGKVLLVGGVGQNGAPVTSAVLYNPD